MADFSMAFSILGDATSLIAATGESEAALGRLDATGTRTSNTLANAFGAAAVAGIVALGAGLVSTINTAANFEQQISAISAVAGTGAASIDQLRATALQLGKDTSFSASEAAAGMEEMVKAGLSIADVMNGGARAALDLAAAGGLSVAEAATVASNAMNAFGLAGTDMAHIADELAGASVASATDVHQLGYALASVGAVAHGIGFTFDDTTTAISLLAQAGLKGSDSGTSLKVMLNQLSPQTKKATEEMQALGIITADGANQFFDAAGNAKDMAGVAQVLQNATANLTKEQKINALVTLFGTDGQRAALILSEQGAAGVLKMADAQKAAGGAQAIANERLNNFRGSLEKLKGSLETGSIMIGSMFLPALKSVADQLTDVVNDALPMIEALPDAWRTVGQVFENDWQPDETLSPFINAVGNAAIEVHGLVDSVMGLPEPVKAAGLAFAAVMVAAGPLSTVLGLMPELFGLLLAPITAVLSPLGLLAAGVAALAYAWSSNLGDVQTKTQDFLGIVGPAFSGLGGIISTAVSGDIAGAFTQFTTLVSTTGTQLVPLLAAWGAEFSAWVPGAITTLQTTLTTAVAAIPWGPIWSGAVTAGTALATFLGTLVVDFATWLGAQAALIPWATVWANAKTAATALGTFIATQTVDFATWLGEQAGRIPWATVWANVKDAGTALGTYVLGLAVDFGAWLGKQAGLIPWATVWGNATAAAGAFNEWVITQAVDFGTWLGEQVVSIKWSDVWANVTGLLEAMSAEFTTSASGIKWGDVITANAAMASDMTTALGKKFEDAITGIKWDVAGQNIGRGFVDAIAVAFGMTEVADAWAVGIGKSLVMAGPKIKDAIVKFLAGILMGAMEEAWNLAIASWVPGAPTVTAPNPAATPGSGATPGWQVQWPGQGVAPGVQGPPIPPGFEPGQTAAPATGVPSGPVYGPSIPPGFSPSELTPQPPSVSSAPRPPSSALASAQQWTVAQTRQIQQTIMGGDMPAPPPFDPNTTLAQRMQGWAPTLQWLEANTGFSQAALAGLIGAENQFGDSPLSGRANNYFSITRSPYDTQALPPNSTPGVDDTRFPSYPSPEANIARFVGLIGNPENENYQGAFRARGGDPGSLYQALAQGGYIADEVVNGISYPTSGWYNNATSVASQYTRSTGSGSPSTALPMPSGAAPIAALPAPQPPRGGLIPAGVANFEQNQQAWDQGFSDANAICGPHLAALFASAVGRPPTRDEAVQLAQRMNIYDPTGAGSGIKDASQYDEYASALIQQINPGSPYSVAQTPVGSLSEASTLAQQSLAGGAPIVGFNTPNHYFGATGYDPSTGTFHVGGTGTSFRNGSADMTIQQIASPDFGGGLTNVITLLGQFQQVAAGATTSMSDFGQSNAATTPELAGVGAAIDPVVASMDAGTVSVGGMTDAIIASAAQQGVATESATAYATGLTSQQTALEGVLAGFAATTPAAAELLTQLQSGAITSDQAAVAFAGLATTTATATGAIGDASGVMSEKVLTDFGVMTDGASTDAATMDANVSTAVGTMTADVSTLSEGMNTSVSTSAATMDANASLSAATMQGAVGAAVDGMVGAVVTLADGMNTSVSTSAETMNTDATGSAQTMQADVGAAVYDMVSAVVPLADGMNQSVAGSTDAMNVAASGSADEMKTSVTGSAQDMSTKVGDALGALDQPLSDMATGFEDAGTKAGDATPPVEDFASAAASVKPINMGDTVKNLQAVERAAKSAATALDKLGEAGKHVSGGSDGPDDEGKGGHKGGGGKAAGGPVYSDTMYVVGEQGPELFVPSVSGVIVPNHKLRGLATGGAVMVDGINPLGAGDPGDLGAQLLAATVRIGDLTTQSIIPQLEAFNAFLGDIRDATQNTVVGLAALGHAMVGGVSGGTRTAAPTTPVAVPGAPAIAAPAAGSGKPTAPLPPGYEYKEFSPGVWGVQTVGTPVGLATPITSQQPLDIGTGRPGGAFVAEPGISPFNPHDIGAGTGTGGHVTEPRPGTSQPSDVGTGRGPGSFVAEPHITPHPATGGTIGGGGSPEPGHPPLQIIGGGAASPVSGHGTDTARITAPLSAADATVKRLATNVAANTAVMQIAATAQSNIMATRVASASDVMSNNVSADVASLADGTISDFDGMSTAAVTSAEAMSNGTISAADAMQTRTVLATTSMYDDSIPWFRRLHTEGVVQMGDLRDGAGNAAAALTDQVAAPNRGHLFNAYSQGVTWLARLSAEGVDQVSGVHGLTAGVLAATGGLNDGLNNPNSRGELYLAYSGGVGWLNKLNVDGTAQADLAKTAITGKLGEIKGSADLIPTSYQAISAAGTTMANTPFNSKKLTDELDKIKNAANGAANAIKNIPSSPGGGGGKDIASILLASGGIDTVQAAPPAMAPEAFARMLARELAAVLQSSPSTHPVNLSLTVEPVSQEWEITEARAGSGT